MGRVGERLSVFIHSAKVRRFLCPHNPMCVAFAYHMFGICLNIELRGVYQSGAEGVPDGLTARINVLFDIEERANLYYINGDGDNSNSNPDPNPNSEGGGGDDPVPSEG